LHWKDLKVWQKAHELVVRVYQVSAKFPKAEMYGTTSQIRRAAASVPANIVEGQSRNSTKEYIHFLYNARGSLEETRYFLSLARDLEYLINSDYELLETEYEQVSRMLNGPIASLRRSKD
jgi:four helix bundle protein